ncbi:MAG: four helix bundle protein [Candidatus Sulfotelmatobacter sp.]
MSRTYADLEVWQAAMELAVRIYRLTKEYPRDELYGLTSQLRRAAVSVASNIAEGKGRSLDRELIQFLCHSRGSLFEVETQLAIGRHLGYGTDTEYIDLSTTTAKIGRMINGLIRSVDANNTGTSRRKIALSQP